MPAPNTILQGRYRVIRQLGRGGMGAVYEATDIRLSRRVAIKQTLVQTDALRQAFDREARLLANLRHPALPKIIDHTSEGEDQFLVMEFIPGDDLEQILSKRGYPFPPHRVLNWTLHLLDALTFLHEHNPPIIHRDIKPSNLKLTELDGVILLDFGLAKGYAGEMTRASASSIFGYSQHYSSLEQIQGEGTSPQSDLYSLAATVYHLLTGTLPADALKRTTELMFGNADPLKPIESFTNYVPSGFARTIMRTLSLNPRERPTSAAEMRAELFSPERPIIDYTPVPTIVAPPPQLAQAPEALPELEGKPRSYAWPFAIFALVVLMFTAGAIYQILSNNEGADTDARKEAASIKTPTPLATPTPFRTPSTYSYTPSPVPISTPVSTPTPPVRPLSFHRSVDVINAYVRSGLEVEDSMALNPNPSSRSLALRTMDNGARFTMPSICSECDAWIYSFNSDEEAVNAEHYLISLSAKSFAWVFRKGNVIAQLSGVIPEDKANQYRDALINMR